MGQEELLHLKFMVNDFTMKGDTVDDALRKAALAVQSGEQAYVFYLTFCYEFLVGEKNAYSRIGTTAGTRLTTPRTEDLEVMLKQRHWV